MAMKITSDVLESYLHCKFKGHLKLAGQEGTKCDFEAMIMELRAEVRLKAIDAILARHPGDQVARSTPLTTAGLKRGPQYILDGTFEDDVLALQFDGLKRVAGESKLGDFHYVPVLFHENRRIKKQQKLLLEFYGMILSNIQGRVPAYGVVWHGRDCKATRVKLNHDHEKAEQVLQGLKDMLIPGLPPRLLLNAHCQVCEFRQRCSEQAAKEGNITLLRGLGEREVKRYAKKGIFTVTQLAHTFRPRRKGKRAKRGSNKRHHALQALAIRDNKIYVFGTPELPESPVTIYLDMEGVPEEGYIYLIGMIVVENGSESRYSFWAESVDQEAEVLEKFLGEVARFDNFLVLCYGGFERASLRRMRKTAKRKKLVDRVLNRLVNVLSVVYSHVYFPSYSNGLKDIAACLGCSWTETDASGIQSIVWRKKWETTQDEELKLRLTTYNLEDCVALRKLVEFTRSIEAEAAKGTTPTDTHGPQVGLIEAIDKIANTRKWGAIRFFHPDYDYINRRAYFDYQRQRVYARTNPRLRKSIAAERRRRNHKLRISKRVKITASTCPFCSSSNVTRDAPKKLLGYRGPRVKKAFDLIITGSGIRRKTLECRTSVHQCNNCGKAFIPSSYQRIDPHFHSLKSWAVYQHVAHRISFGTLQQMLWEFFGLHVRRTQIHIFQALMARYYRTAYRKLLRRILSGNVLQIDETEVVLRTGKGYVWVLTNLEDVVFMYRPTREGDFLRPLLEDFDGVLVSDFYAAYDSIGCPQQKCLIHLIRDINDSLLANPFDEELRSITHPFGVLLRSIVATIDQHGLKRRHLGKHERDVERFFKALVGGAFRSEAAQALSERLLKHRDKLFTFIHHDGVPWNNNNAENAVKRFAWYRAGTVGLVTEAGLNDYLVLLSIYQSCRYRGIGFLKFLLSRERDIDLFRDRRRPRRKPPLVELYPKGFTHPCWSKLGRPTSEENDSASSAASDPADK
jgi:predicted RecB family nuclease